MRAFITLIVAFFAVLAILLNPFSIYFEAKYQREFFLNETRLNEFSELSLKLINSEFERLNLLKNELIKVAKNYLKLDEPNLITQIQNKAVLEPQFTQINIAKMPLNELEQNPPPIVAKPKIDETALAATKKDEPNLPPIKPKKDRPQPKIVAKSVNLEANSTLILIGDSIMSGLGWGLENLLKSRDVKVKNLAKSSTGLLNKKFYDWQSELDNILAQNSDKNAALMVLFGANDTYGYTFDNQIAKFDTDEWKSGYKKRIKEIYSVAKKHDVRLIWIGQPCMSKEKYSQKMESLNQIYKSIADENGVSFISLSDALCQDGKFIKSGEDKKPLRSDDGMHLSTHGSIQAAKFVIIELLKKD